jgi:hypothetical protein
LLLAASTPATLTSPCIFYVFDNDLFPPQRPVKHFRINDIQL